MIPSPILFMIACTLHAGAAFLGLIAPKERPFAMPSARMITPALAAFALFVHAGALVARAVEAQRLPIQNQYESLTAVAFMAACAGVLLGGLTRRRAPAIAGFTGAALMLLAALDLPIPGKPIEPEAPILSTASLLKFHVTTVIAGYGLAAVGGMLGLVWLFRPASRDALARAQATAARLTFWVLGVGVLLGAWWAHGAWGRWWAFDAKETWALITWSAYFLPVHAAAVRGDRRAGRTVAWSNLIGMLAMLWSYFGVNLLLVSLHAYA